MFIRSILFLMPTVLLLITNNNITYIRPAAAFPENDSARMVFTSTPERIQKGKVLYEKNCMMCHGSKGKGDGSAGIYLNPRPKDLNAAEIKAKSDKALFDWITKGKAPMPSYGHLSSEAREELVIYIRQLMFNNDQKTKSNAK